MTDFQIWLTSMETGGNQKELEEKFWNLREDMKDAESQDEQSELLAKMNKIQAVLKHFHSVEL